MKRRIVGVAVAAFVACAPQIARADVITVTSGWLSWDSDLGPTHASMVLDSSPFSQFSFAVLETPLSGTVNAGGHLQPGQTVAFSTEITDVMFASGNLNGVTYRSPSLSLPDTNFQGDLRFTASPIVLPPFSARSEPVNVTAPFTLAGFLRLTT